MVLYGISIEAGYVTLLLPVMMWYGRGTIQLVQLHEAPVRFSGVRCHATNELLGSQCRTSRCEDLGVWVIIHPVIQHPPQFRLMLGDSPQSRQ